MTSEDRKLDLRKARKRDGKEGERMLNVRVLMSNYWRGNELWLSHSLRLFNGSNK
jgi:hypothetical protein